MADLSRLCGSIPVLRHGLLNGSYQLLSPFWLLFYHVYFDHCQSVSVICSCTPVTRHGYHALSLLQHCNRGVSKPWGAVPLLFPVGLLIQKKWGQLGVTHNRPPRSTKEHPLVHLAQNCCHHHQWHCLFKTQFGPLWKRHWKWDGIYHHLDMFIGCVWQCLRPKALTFLLENYDQQTNLGLRGQGTGRAFFWLVTIRILTGLNALFTTTLHDGQWRK